MLQNSLKGTLAIRISLTLFLLYICTTSFLVIFSINSVTVHSQQEIQSQAKNYQDIFSQHLWFFDMKAIENMGRIAIHTSDIVGLRVEDHSGKTILQLGVIGEKNATTILAPLVHGGTVEIGALELSFFDSYAQEARRTIFVISFVVVVISIFCVLFIVFWILKKHLEQPLSNLQETMISAVDGEYKFVTSGNSKKELNSIIKLFNRMIKAIKDREKSQKKAEKKLSESEHLLSEAQRMARIGSWVFDKKTNQLTWSHETYQIFEVNKEGHGHLLNVFLAAIHPEDKSVVLASYNTSLKTKQPYMRSHRLLMADGRIKFVQEYCENEFDESGVLTKSIGTIQDITDRVHSERDQEKLKKQLAQSQKMESIGTLAGGIAHDFNNILAAILGFSELALGGTTKDSAVAKDIGEVYAAGLRAKELVQQILTFARQSDEEKAPVDVGYIVQQALKFVRSSIPSTIEIKQSIHCRSLIMGNSTQLHRVILNLCTNATHAMEKNGGILEVVVTRSTVTQAMTREGQYLNQGNYVEIKIVDSGEGIAPDILEKIYEPYFTTKKQGEGTGLGLAMVHSIIETYGGKIFVESSVGQGSTFTIYLPILSQDEEPVLQESDDLLTGQERIMVVDDEPPVAKLTGRLLRQLGYSVTECFCSVKALEIFSAHPTEFDLVITDMTMPKMTGDLLAMEMMKIKPNLPVILCTGYSKEFSEKKAAEIGVKEFIYKPIAKDFLAKTMRSVLDHKTD